MLRPSTKPWQRKAAESLQRKPTVLQRSAITDSESASPAEGEAEPPPGPPPEKEEDTVPDLRNPFAFMQDASITPTLEAASPRDAVSRLARRSTRRWQAGENRREWDWQNSRRNRWH
ncbi:hypothetical protein V8E53_009121 [Lactarius tabidus]